MPYEIDPERRPPRTRSGHSNTWQRGSTIRSTCGLQAYESRDPATVVTTYGPRRGYSHVKLWREIGPIRCGRTRSTIEIGSWTGDPPAEGIRDHLELLSNRKFRQLLRQ